MSASICQALSLAQRDEELHDLNLHGAGAAPDWQGFQVRRLNYLLPRFWMGVGAMADFSGLLSHNESGEGMAESDGLRAFLGEMAARE
jgi:hypothetical protein